MKRKIFGIIFLMLFLCLSIVACSTVKPNEKPENFEPPIANTPTPEEEVFILPKGDDWYSKIEGIDYGKTEYITYHSALTNAEKHANIVLPAGYSSNSSKYYPVLYLLHGLGMQGIMSGDENSWIDMGAKYIIQNLHKELNIPEMIIVCVNCIVNEMEEQPPMNSEELTIVYDKTSEDIVESVMPYVNKNYRTLQDKNNTAIAGYSMGGREAILTAFKYQDKFGYIGAFSSAPFGKNVITSVPNVPDFKIDENSTGFKKILLCVGGLDTIAGVTRALDEKLTNANITHLCYSVPFGNHLPPVWRNGLYNFAKRIFV